MVKIKQKGILKEYLRDEGYDLIIFWKDGSWDLASTGYGGEQDGNNPVASINRVYNYDLTHKQIDKLVKEIEEKINNNL